MSVVVMPDIELPMAVLKKVMGLAGPPLFSHPSGRPWIVGGLGGRNAVSAKNGTMEIVLIGAEHIDGDRLARSLRDRKSVGQIDDLAAEFAEGDVLLFAREPGRMRSQAPVFLMRSLFWIRWGTTALISDDQLTLKVIGDLRPDPAVLAGRLTDAELSHPFALAGIWRGISTIGCGQWLDSRGDAPPSRVVWWRPPGPDRPLAELSDPLREHISGALLRRTAGHTSVSADLSGGLDSTTLNFFLAALGRRPRTLYLSSDNVANNDRQWAERAASEIGTKHHVVPYAAVLPYLLDPQAGTLSRFPEGPTMAAASIAAVPLIEDVMADTGSTLHINGHGGDALFGTVSTMLWSLFHSKEKGRILRSWRHRVVNRFPLRETLAMIARNESYQDDLEMIARSDFRAPADDISSQSRWIHLPNAHPALTDVARQHLRDLAKHAMTDGYDALSTDRTNHQILQYLTVHGNVVRRMNQASTRIRFDSPYLDRRIVETSLALRIGDRFDQVPAKPLLAAARPPAMSLDYFQRHDKGDYTAEVFQQHLALKPALKELFADGSVLEDWELVSAEQVMRSIGDFSVDGRAYTALLYLAFAERWLRSATGG